MNDIKYQNSCTELTEILKTLSEEDLNKIPKSIIESIYNNRNTNYEFMYSKYKTLEEQNVSNVTKQMIIVLFKNYFANEKQKQWILNQEKIALKNSEEKSKEKYDVNNIFKNTDKNEELKLELVYNNSEKSEQLIDKILDFIFGKRIDIK